MKKKKEVGKNQKRLNKTAHQRAMTNSNVQETFSALRSNWNDLSFQQRGEQLQKLIAAKCSVRGIARDLGKPEANIRRYIAPANSPDEGGDWIATMKLTLAAETQEQTKISALEAARESVSMFQRNRKAGPLIKERCLAEDPEHSSTAQHRKKITTPTSTGAKEAPALRDVVNGQENRAERDNPKMSVVDQYNLTRGSFSSDRIQRLANISETIERRPYRDARSMDRQGSHRRRQAPSDPFHKS